MMDREAPTVAKAIVYTVDAMWSRPIRMAAENNRRLSGSASASSHTAEAWVMVTSLRTPSPATVIPQMTTAVSRMSGGGRGQDVVILRGDPGEVGPTASHVAQAGDQDEAEKRAKERGGYPCAEPVGRVEHDEHDGRRADKSDGGWVRTADQRGEHELHQDEPGEAQPEQRDQSTQPGDADNRGREVERRRPLE